jgi:hypothetical protein
MAPSRALVLSFLVAACAPKPPAPAPAPTPAPAPAVPDEEHIQPAEVDFEPKWRGTSFGAYLAPKWDWAKDGGSVDVLFELHAGQLAEKQWRAAGVKAVVVVVAFGMGSGPYDQAFQSPARFGRMLDEVMTSMGADEAGRANARPGGSAPLHVRRLGIISFSAGFGAVNRILRQPGYADRVDALLLLDSLHTAWNDDKKPDVRGIEPYVRFAEEAKSGRKVMVLTHSSIKTYDAYPDSTATAGALLDAIGVARVPLGASADFGSMRPIYRADAGAFHAIGFKGETKEDHMDHLALAGDLVKRYVARRWARMEALEGASGHP